MPQAAPAMLPILLLLGVASACANEIGPRERRDAAMDAASGDASGAADAMDGASAPDASLLDAAASDASEADAASACTPTRTSCRGELECGAGPNGCPGGTLDCGECTGGEAWCAVLEPAFLARVRMCVSSIIDARADYFDPALACAADSPFVLEARAAEYVRDVAACVTGSGAVAIVDPNAPVNEIRVRADDADIADNYPVRVYATGCTRRAYTSSCSPAGF